MQHRFISIWFPHLKTDWQTRRNAALQGVPFVLAAPDHGRMIVTATNALAEKQGIYKGITVADARAIRPALQVLDDDPQCPLKILRGFAEWFIRYTPVVAADLPDGLIMEVTGCTHLWGSESKYVADVKKRLTAFGYSARIAMAGTIGTAWAVARYAQGFTIVESGQEMPALIPLPPAALRLEREIAERLEKLGLRQTGSFISMPRTALRRRFGLQLLKRLDQALGCEEETIIPQVPIEPYQERLPCLEYIVTATGIEIALKQLLETLCTRLKKEEKGLRAAIFKCYRIDGKIEKIEIGTNRASGNTHHLFKLFEIKIDTIEPALGIELFTLDALKVEGLETVQKNLWENSSGLNDTHLAELLDRIEGKTGAGNIYRYVPDEHYWPERSFKAAASIDEKIQTPWKTDRPRPSQLLTRPEPIEVTAPIPDYPPMLFRYKGILHKIIKADGPERIEPEWWLQQGQHRDYYYVEDEQGHRYWLFRLGHYDAALSYQWFIHGFFA